MSSLSRHHQRTLEQIWVHPITHNLRLAEVEALLIALGAELKRQGGRLEVRFAAGPVGWIHSGGGGLRQGDLDAEAIERLRHLLQAAGVSPQHPQMVPEGPRGDQALRLVVLLDHHQTRLWRLEGELIDHAVLRPHGLWATGERLSHRHDRDIAGQRAPLDYAYLEQIAAAMAGADAVLLLGHGHGESDMRSVLLRHLQTRHPALAERIVAIETVDDSAFSEGQLLALARERFGNLPHRHSLLVPGQEPRFS
ncbi:MAG: hypothetical protein VKL97_01170 [Cyanobacteriota bacterium]|nr:hypothetical protein [Cyanobacteriota bacterium]